MADLVFGGGQGELGLVESSGQDFGEEIGGPHDDPDSDCDQ